MINLKQPVICIVGPTASGKTDVAQLVAKARQAEVISADSMQIYKGMDIGTGKLPANERIVPHHGFDLIDPGKPYSASLFQDFARSVIGFLDEQGKQAVLCGGTGFYVRAVIDNYEFPAGEQTDNPVREHYQALADEHGNQWLWDELNRRDPKSAALIHANNVRRVIRAFELLEEGTTYAAGNEHLSQIEAYLPSLQFGLQWDPDTLKTRINQRVDAMVEAGLAGEVETLLQSGFKEGLCAPQAIGYKEIVAALEGECTMDEAIEAIKQATRRYAKRQRTWFRRDKRIRWIEADHRSADSLSDEILSLITRQ